MFLLVLTYSKPLEEVEPFMTTHMAWVDAQYQNGTFVASGRRVPRTGGIILARATDRASLEAVAATDPFLEAGVAHYDLIEFTLSRTAPGFESLLS
ncbi:YciI family protein [Hymenobacter crusticola]|uniref:YCII-related domain-containing protein n=1 Tax=Hymenobacter crusticola TaxID=1770526 RepID=A0A243WF78_9BACT|nr:YciI family protein [Hymenobacter crusticola]OUJ73787.1 hypothetical protein BXP70_12480 [Hymenobacter crusticola]